MQFLFPCDYFEKHKPDALFAAQAEALQARGHSVHCLDFDSPASRARPQPAPAPLLYRGYMLRAEGYADLEARIAAQGSQLLIPQASYLLSHHLPNWYPLLRDFTPETRVYPDAETALQALPSLGWERVFLKDYVKSLKTATGSLASGVAEAAAILAELADFRDGLEGGVVLRRVEELDPASEKRYFVWQGKAFGPDEAAIPAPVLACRERVASPFYAVDIAWNAAGEPRLVELGDGQVSDLVGWEAERFAAIFAQSP